MSISAVTSKDVLNINGRQMRNFADGDVIKLDPTEPLTNVTTGKDQNSIYAYNYKGKNMKLEFRLIIGSADDQYMVALLQQYNRNAASFSLLPMEYDKNIGDGQGNITQTVYLGTGMTFEYQPSIAENASGETSQAVHVWKMIIADVNISIT